jgi:AcrR family transcriptional regulator
VGRGRAAPDQASDRRLARGDHSRLALLEAMIDLIDGRAEPPSAKKVARRAGISRRMIFNHFEGGMDGLLVGAVELALARQHSQVRGVPPRGPTPPRVRALCRQRRQLFEQLGPVYRTAYARASMSSGLVRVLAAQRSVLRGQLAHTMAPELRASGADAGLLLDALELATGWEAWCGLRDLALQSASAAERAMTFAAGQLLR